MNPKWFSNIVNNLCASAGQIKKAPKNNWRGRSLKTTKSKCDNKTTLEKKTAPSLSLYYCLNVGHLWPACGCGSNPTLCNTVISVSTNVEAEMSVKRILVSLKVLHGWRWIWKTCINNTMGARRSIVSTFHGILTVKRNLWLSVWRGCFT